MANDQTQLREQSRRIWQAAVDAVRPRELIRRAFRDNSDLKKALQSAPRILVVGAGKAGAAMATAVEQELTDVAHKIEGIVNVPEDESATKTNGKIRRHAARPAGTNQPTAEGVDGAESILQLVAGAGPDDVALCLVSGGGSALLPAPVAGISLADKQQVTKLLHQCGATINEMNAVRKHLSRIKGGRLAQSFTGRALFSLIVSDVIGDPLDVIASGPTAADSSTFADALGVLEKYQILQKTPASVRDHLQVGQRGEIAETPKSLPESVHNFILGNNNRALRAAQSCAEQLGYQVVNLGSFIEGETREVGIALAGIVRSVQRDGVPSRPPVCILSGGETTVTLATNHGSGGRNQEMILAMLQHLGADGLRNTVLLSGGTDGEDGPTDAAGAIADESTWQKAGAANLLPTDYLSRNDAYHFFKQTNDLLKTGLTQTNVMDVRVFLIDESN